MQTIKTFKIHRSNKRSVNRIFEFRDMRIQNRPNYIPSPIFDSVKCTSLYQMCNFVF